VRLGGVDQRLGERVDRARRVPRRIAREERDVGRHLVVARARGVQLAPHGTRDLRHAPLDRHVDVLVAVLEREGTVDQLLLDGGEPREQLVAVVVADDPPGGEHARVRA
jgi:hypothetical protein